MINKVGDEYHVMSKSGEKCLGKYKTKGEAEKRLKQVEYYKHYTAHKEKSEKGHGKKHEQMETPAQERAEHKK
jgi:hypothetical protein